MARPTAGLAGRPCATCTCRPPTERPEALGWPTASLRAGHFHALVDPDGLAAAMLALPASM